MKNLSYFPYERNKYFYGKLLSVDDFETEQRYMNDKRRMGNRFLHGSGVVCGLQVVQIDESTFSLEAGMAVDFSGRELVVEKPQIKSLWNIDGFEHCKEEAAAGSPLYLCMEYAEYEREPVYQVASDSRSSDAGKAFNKVMEGVHLFLTTERLEENIGRADNFYEEAVTVYWGEGVRISHVFPRYVQSGREFTWKLVVENRNQQPVKFQYTLGLTCLENQGKNFIDVTFDEEKYPKSSRYEIPFHTRAMSVNEIEGRAQVMSQNMELFIGERKVGKLQMKGTSQTYISEKNPRELLRAWYFEHGMERITEENRGVPLYLAEISLISGEETWIIDSMRQLPFGQTIQSGMLSALMERSLSDELSRMETRMKYLEGQRHFVGDEERRGADAGFRTSRGTAVIKLGIGGTAGRRFFSQEIPHGLGLGAVQIVLGQAYTLRDDSMLVFGDGDIFKDKQCSVKGKLAARLDVTKGTFVVGLELSETTVSKKVLVHWMAFAEEEQKELEREDRGIYLKPDMVHLKLRENYHFEPVFNGMADRSVTWAVKEADGGSIEENGIYTAPNQPGVYEIQVKSTVYPEIQAVAFAVVRDI